MSLGDVKILDFSTFLIFCSPLSLASQINMTVDFSSGLTLLDTLNWKLGSKNTQTSQKGRKSGNLPGLFFWFVARCESFKFKILPFFQPSVWCNSANNYFQLNPISISLLTIGIQRIWWFSRFRWLIASQFRSTKEVSRFNLTMANLGQEHEYWYIHYHVIEFLNNSREFWTLIFSLHCPEVRKSRFCPDVLVGCPLREHIFSTST